MEFIRWIECTEWIAVSEWQIEIKFPSYKKDDSFTKWILVS